MTFRIEWRAREDVWNDARAVAQVNPAWSRRELGRALPMELPLVGEVQFRRDGHVLFPIDVLHRLDVQMRDDLVAQGDPWYPVSDVDELLGMTVALTGLAAELIAIAEQFRHPPLEQRILYRDALGSLGIAFEKRGDWVRLPSWESTFDFVVPLDEFLAEVERFLIAFVTMIEYEVPEILNWEAFAWFRPFRMTKDDS